MAERADLRFLLIQARRGNDQVRAEEHAAFAQRLGVAPSQIESVDVTTETLDPARRQDVNAVLVGGAGEFGVVTPIEPVRSMIEFLTDTAERGFPLFGSCFGFQALVVGLGGTVVEDEENAEVGTYEMTCVDAVTGDPVFGDLPQQFLAQLGHKDRVASMPAGVTNLVQSEQCPYQALRIDGTSVYATQFHPELTWTDNQLRFARYMDHYGRLFGEEEAQRRLDGHRPSPEANALLGRYVSAFLLEGEG